MAWFKTKPAGTDSLKTSDDMIRANWTEVELRRLYNLVANAAFGWRSGGTSAVPDGWSLEGTPTVAYDTVDVGYGNYAVKLTASGATDEGIKQTLTNLKVSTKYQVFVRMKVTDGDTASLITTGATTNINEDSTSATWESITGEFVTDASATDVVIKLVASADGDVAYFCGITVVEGDIPPANFIRRIDEDNIGATTISAAQWGIVGALTTHPLGGDGTAGRILRRSYLTIANGTDAATLKCTLSNRWNGDVIAETNNVAKGATTGSFTLSADGFALTIENPGLTGICICAWGNCYFNASGTALTWYIAQTGDDISIIPRNATTGGDLDMTTLVDTGIMRVTICYITSA